MMFSLIDWNFDLNWNGFLILMVNGMRRFDGRMSMMEWWNCSDGMGDMMNENRGALSSILLQGRVTLDGE
jgi:hypothetical protein